MKKLLLMLSLLPSGPGYAVDESGVDVKSFRFVRRDDYLAEFCAKVTAAGAENARVIIKVDPKYDPAPYVATPGVDGVFCTLVWSRTGYADVSLYQPKSLQVGQTISVKADQAK